MGRDTSTGQVLEAMVLPALKRGGYEYQTQVIVGTRPNGRKHRVDATACKNEKNILISMKWQQVSGTAEQKVPFEVICLIEAMQQASLFCIAYIVLGGNGWTLRDYYISGGLSTYIRPLENIRIVTLEAFIALANKGNL